MTTCEVLEEALKKGGKAVWRPRPALLVPKGMGEMLRGDLETVREVMRRAAVFCQQAIPFLKGAGADPLFILVLDQEPGGGCVSCHAPVTPGRFRCALCALAVTIALSGLEVNGT